MSGLGCIDTHQYVRGNKWSRSIPLSSSFYRHLTLTTLLSNPDTRHHVTCTFTTHGVCVTVDRCECRYMWCMSRIFYILTLLRETLVKHLLNRCVCGTHVLVLRTRTLCVQVWSLLCVLTRSVGGLNPDTKYRKPFIWYITCAACFYLYLKPWPEFKDVRCSQEYVVIESLLLIGLISLGT